MKMLPRNFVYIVNTSSFYGTTSRINDSLDEEPFYRFPTLYSGNERISVEECL